MRISRRANAATPAGANRLRCPPAPPPQRVSPYSVVLISLSIFRCPSSAYRDCGNLAFVSQKSLMLFTRASKAFNCTGLVR